MDWIKSGNRPARGNHSKQYYYIHINQTKLKVFEIDLSYNKSYIVSKNQFTSVVDFSKATLIGEILQKFNLSSATTSRFIDYFKDEHGTESQSGIYLKQYSIFSNESNVVIMLRYVILIDLRHVNDNNLDQTGTYRDESTKKPCADSPCFNDGSCIPTNITASFSNKDINGFSRTFECSCSGSYFGNHCSKNLYCLNCERNKCIRPGMCHSCNPGWEGNDCLTVSCEKLDMCRNNG
ncbi:hypothetical protein RF11_15668 [Thelohanellus kitauei]|uniref:EGF-like domain-containing protein n=1 Tax=Thelohanellus kitauei TaxID=669202 RepID=A0A0C2N0I7_THEKT|nr:hypothetical protein RF11_15668 [Thelohanellus kitauei]